MVRYLVIVSREQAALCDYLRQAFSGDDKVQIILDRRGAGGERLHPRPLERRWIDRRSQRGVDHELQVLGFAIARGHEPAAGSDRRAPDQIEERRAS
jgi:hypothetical protein